MNISYEWLKKKKMCKEGAVWFLEKYGKEKIILLDDLINDLLIDKKEQWISWLKGSIEIEYPCVIMGITNSRFREGDICRIKSIDDNQIATIRKKVMDGEIETQIHIYNLGETKFGCEHLIKLIQNHSIRCEYDKYYGWKLEIYDSGISIKYCPVCGKYYDFIRVSKEHAGYLANK